MPLRLTKLSKSLRDFKVAAYNYQKHMKTEGNSQMIVR